MMEQGRKIGRTRFEDVIVDLDETLEAYSKVHINVAKELNALGVEPRPKPDMPAPKLERAVSDMTSEELGDFQGVCSSWEAYLGRQFAIYKTKEAALKERRGALLSILKKELRSRGVPASAVGDEAKDDPRFRKADTEYLQARGVALSLERELSGVDKLRIVCSRHVEIVTRELDSHTRTENVNNRRRAAPPRFRR